MEIAYSNTREKYPLSEKKILKKSLPYFILISFPCTVLSIVFYLSGSAGIGTLILFLVFVVSVIVYLYQRWYFAVYYYDLTEDIIVIRKGPITPKEINIPYERIQDVYVDQDILDRIMGLYDVHVSSATVSSGKEAHIDGVEKVVADGLRGDLLETVKEKIHKARSGESAEKIS